MQYFPSSSITLRELEPVHWVTWSGSRFIMSGAVRLRAVRAALYELFVHSGRIRTVTQGVHMTYCVIYCVIVCQLKYSATCRELFKKQPVIMSNVSI